MGTADGNYRSCLVKPMIECAVAQTDVPCAASSYIQILAESVQPRLC
jgi:hypothetical protein